jgi:WD40 repeat protein
MSTSFKTPARVARVMGECHNQLRQWVDTMLYPTTVDADNPNVLPSFDPVKFDRSIMGQKDSTFKLTKSALSAMERACIETSLCADRGLATLNKFIDDEKERGSETRAQVLGFLVQIELAVDSYLTALSPIVSGTLFSELLGKSNSVSTYITKGSKLASHFLRLFLPLCQRTLDTLMGEDQTWLMQTFIHQSIAHCTTAKEKRLVMKIRLLNAAFQSLDLYVFPKTYHIHQAGSVKCIAMANRRPNVVATASYDGTVILYGLHSGDGSVNPNEYKSTIDTEQQFEDKGQVIGIFRGHKSIVTWCAFSPMDHYLYSCSFDGTLRKWGTSTGHCLRVGKSHQDSILDADLNTDGTCTWKSSLFQQLSTPIYMCLCFLTLFLYFSGPFLIFFLLFGVLFGYTGTRLCTCSMDSSIKIWNAASMSCTHTYRGHASGSWIKSVCFSRNDKRIISVGLDKRIVVWSSASSSNTSSTVKMEDGKKVTTVGALRILENAHSDFILAVASHSKPTRNTTTTATTATTTTTTTIKMKDKLIEEDVHMVASISKDGTVTVWNMEAAEGVSCVLATLTMPHGTSCWPCCLCFSSDVQGSLIAIGCINNIILIFTTHSPEHNLGSIHDKSHFKKQRQLRVMNSGILCVNFTKDNDALLVGTVDGTIQRIEL